MDLQTRLLILDKKNLVNDLVESMADEDEDYNGNNGIDYITEGAREEGFDSDLEYQRAHLSKMRGKGERKIKAFFSDYFASSFYDDYVYDIYEEKDRYIVSVSWVHCD